MTILDVNILLFAYNDNAPEHKQIANWLEDLVSREELIVLPWITVLGFLRLSTNSAVYSPPLLANESLTIIEELLSRPNISLAEQLTSFTKTFKSLCVDAKVSNKLFTDAYLVTVALENNARLASCDLDFARFTKSGLKWTNPLDE